MKLFQLSQLQIAELAFILVVSEENVAAYLFAKSFDGLELAPLDSVHHGLAAAFVGENLRSIQPMLDVVAFDDQA